MDEIKEDEKNLVEAMRSLPDFTSFVFPSSWYKKYNIPLAEAVNPREYIKSNYAMKMAVAPKDLPPIFIDEPQKDAEGKVKLIDPPALEHIPMEVVQRPLPPEEFKDGRTPAIHPSLRD
jgi:hypothetical protein